MRRVNKTSLSSRTSVLLRGNEGTSLVLVSIIAIIVITAVIVLRISTSALWASADKQVYQDQAYELATSMGESVDTLIGKGKINLSSICTDDDIHQIAADSNTGIPNSDIAVTVRLNGDLYEVVTTAHVARATYVYTATYKGSGTSYTRQY
ncbi:MAG: hypothetical protein K6F45_10595 [Saccharofermentans sp.]|nr:hypothetical protein [Saccharofermentans sp.]